MKLRKWLKFRKLVGKMMNYFTNKLEGSHTHARWKKVFYSMFVPTGPWTLCRNPSYATEGHSWAAPGTQNGNHRAVLFFDSVNSLLNKAAWAEKFGGILIWYLPLCSESWKEGFISSWELKRLKLWFFTVQCWPSSEPSPLVFATSGQSYTNCNK